MSTDNPKGSIWHRWEPHIHIPGTILNDQYAGTTVADFCSAIEKADPPIKALGITDYYSLASYEKIQQEKINGRLPGVDLIFPNIELRLKLGTSANKFVNGHLLFSPDDPNHISEIKRFLSKLTFKTSKEEYACTELDLIKLGKEHDPSVTDDAKALAQGTNQFKVDFDQLMQNLEASAWAQQNLLIAVAGSSNDGTAGLQSPDDAFTATRKRIEYAAHIVFSSADKQRTFWLGKGVLSIEALITEYRGCKPCIHGSDAHKLADIGKPLGDKYTWIKGDLTFESLRQICIEPEDRVIVGAQPLANRADVYVIDAIELTNASWMQPDKVSLNAGLVTVIGARGSGKTALADMIATGAYAMSKQMFDTSFIKRAYDHLKNVTVTLTWLSGSQTTQDIANTEFEDIISSPRVQYLSQKFVDQLCSSEGVSDRLLQEIERVIFNSHPVENRLGLSNFHELLDQKASEARADRESHEEVIVQASESITQERFKIHNLPVLTAKKKELEADINRDKAARNNLLSKDKDARLKTLADVTSAYDKVSAKLDAAQTKLRAITALQQAAVHARTVSFPAFSTKLREGNIAAGLSETDWQAFQVGFKGDVDQILSAQTISSNAEITKIKGLKVAVATDRDPNLSFLTSGKEAIDHPFEVLTQEVERLQKLIGIDTENAKQFSRISDRILKTEGELEKINKDVTDAAGAQARIDIHMQVRKNSYREVFGALLAEETELRNLYQPLLDNLKTQKGSLGKLSFTVKRNAFTDAWAEKGEALLDLRKNGPFRGKGALLDFVNQELKPVWENGSATEISEALAKFRDNHEKGIIEHAQADRSDKIEFSKWANRIANWLYSTEHISITYGVIYDGVDISQLSPGTRGIVLLLLYLSIDREDDRPLIIDQPEENLDPKSIFDELVPLFKEVKNRRQIIIVTHNANLVVNADADQVIIAKAGAHMPGNLPQISYQSGGLENNDIRKGVCEILEGGEEAFKERAKRLRVTI